MTHYGKLKLIHNTDPHWGSAFHYWFLKVRSGPAEWQEEHWLVTEWEAKIFEARGRRDSFLHIRGRIGYLRPRDECDDLGYGSESIVVREPCLHPGPGVGKMTLWVLTPSNLEVIRRRAERNDEDIEKHKEGWLADLID